jgi:hypothetical protein
LVSTPFIPTLGSDAGREFVVVYLVDADGAFLEARIIDDLGMGSEIDAASILTQREEAAHEHHPSARSTVTSFFQGEALYPIATAGDYADALY